MDFTATPILHGDDVQAKREELRRYFHETYDIDEALFKLMADDEAYYRRADPLRHPLIFYFGHTACFFVNKLIMAKVLDKRVNPRFESMFSIGVDEMSWDDLNESHYDWPSVDEVRAFRAQVRDLVDGLISTAPLNLPLSWEQPLWAVLMGCEHARIHLETSSVLIRQLPLDLLRSDPYWPICDESGEPPDNELLELRGGKVKLGKTRDNALYGWDNEYGSHKVDVPAFKAAKYLVSNREFLAFVEDGGYGDERHWNDEGRRWREFKQAEHPLFWRRSEEGQWRLRLVAQESAMPWNWPVEVNYLEAKAFCNWLGEREGRPIRLPSEDEWYLLRDAVLDDDQPYWREAPGNINLEHWASSCPVDRFRLGEFFDVIGNVWQWTETPIYPFQGFEVHPIYDDFSTPTFDDRHNLIKGGSWISTGNEATRDSRYAFRRHFQQHAGFRYIEAAHEAPSYGDPYLSERDIVRSCEAHWGEERLGLGNFYLALDVLCRDHEGPSRGAALHLNCGAGRLVFELAGRYEKALGLDFSARFIRVPDQLKSRGQIHYTLPIEGEIESFHEKRLADFGLDANAARTAFHQDNAANLQSKWGRFDLVVLSDLLDNMIEPDAVLKQVGAFVNPGGLLILACPWQWRAEKTPRAGWLGGYKDATGENQEDLEYLRRVLADDFEPLSEAKEIQRVRFENERRQTVLTEQVSIWRRK